jgi:hypothetical protein
MAKVLKYVRARMDLLNYLAKNSYVPGDKLPSEKELVTRFRMSSIPLRRALDELAEQGLIEKIQGLGNFLRKPVTAMEAQGSIALLDIQPAKPFTLPDFVRELQLLVEQRRMDFRFIPVVQPGGHIDRLISDVTGVMVIGRITPQWATYLEQIKLPLLVLGSNNFPEKFNTVSLDWQQAAWLLTDHFIRSGYRQIGLLNGDIDYFPAIRMFEGYRQALADHGIAYDKKKVIWLTPSNKGFYQNIKQFMDKTPFDALVVESGLIRHLFNWAWNHPEASKPVMGMMEDATTRYIEPEDSKQIVRVQFGEQLLTAAVDTFFSLLSGHEERIHHILKPTLEQ